MSEQTIGQMERHTSSSRKASASRVAAAFEALRELAEYIVENYDPEDFGNDVLLSMAERALVKAQMADAEGDGRADG